MNSTMTHYLIRRFYYEKNYRLGLLSLLLLILTAGSSWAAMGSISSFKFNEATADTIGSGYSQNPTGKRCLLCR
jgi:hypothetical protein